MRKVRRGQTALEWVVLLLTVVVVALGLVKGYATMHMQENMRRTIDKFSTEDLYDGSGSWNYNVDRGGDTPSGSWIDTDDV